MKLVSSGGSDIQASKNKSVAKGKGKKTIPQEIMELPEDVIVVNYEVTTSKMNFDDMFE